MPAGAGDASIFGQPERGRRHECIVEFPASLLKKGNNQIRITTLSGSWIRYDSVTLEALQDIETAPVAATTEMLSAEVKPGEVDCGGSKVRRITVSVLRAGPPVSATFTLGGQPLRKVDLVEGVHSVELFVPVVERPRKVVLAMTLNGQECDCKDLLLTPGVAR